MKISDDCNEEVYIRNDNIMSCASKTKPQVGICGEVKDDRINFADALQITRASFCIRDLKYVFDTRDIDT